MPKYSRPGYSDDVHWRSYGTLVPDGQVPAERLYAEAHEAFDELHQARLCSSPPAGTELELALDAKRKLDAYLEELRGFVSRNEDALPYWGPGGESGHEDDRRRARLAARMDSRTPSGSA